MDKGSRTAVVTGGARGIGKACALALAQTGFNIVIVDLLVDEAEAIAAHIRREACVQTFAIQADVTDLAAAHSAVGKIEEKFGRLDILVNNAGRTNPKGLLEITEDEWDQTINVNLKSCFCWCRAAVPLMRKAGGGRIINMSSLNALNGGVTSAVSKFAYAAAKAGVLGLTKSLAKELGPEIAVNAICPGIIKTELTAGLLEEREGDLNRGISLSRIGIPDDIAQVVVFLATADPNFMTGQHLVVDGGQWIS